VVVKDATAQRRVMRELKKLIATQCLYDAKWTRNGEHRSWTFRSPSVPRSPPSRAAWRGAPRAPPPIPWRRTRPRGRPRQEPNRSATGPSSEPAGRHTPTTLKTDGLAAIGAVTCVSSTARQALAQVSGRTTAGVAKLLLDCQPTLKSGTGQRLRHPMTKRWSSDEAKVFKRRPPVR
jgi:hypothetical protein